MSKIVVIGAGISGVTSAYALLRSGHDVIVIDSHRYPAMETSFANGGQLSASNAEVWNNIDTIGKALRWIFENNAPLLVNPKPSWHKYSWLAEFIWNTRRYREHTIETTRLAIEARKQLFSIAERENIVFDLERRGILHIFYNEKEFRAAAEVNRLLQAGGLERHPVTSQEVREIEPVLKGAYYGGFFTPSDATGDIHKFTRGLADVCIQKGATFLQDTTLTRVEARDGRFFLACSSEQHSRRQSGRSNETVQIDASKIVICAGVGSRRIASKLGDRVNVYPVKGYSITVQLEDDVSQHGAPWASLLDESSKIVTSRLGVDRFRVAGTAEFNGFNRDIRADRVEPLINWVRENFPDVNTAHIVPWAGLRPMMPSMMPTVRRGRLPGVYYNTGHGHLGWTLSAATAEMLAQLVESDSPA